MPKILFDTKQNEKGMPYGLKEKKVFTWLNYFLEQTSSLPLPGLCQQVPHLLTPFSSDRI